MLLVRVCASITLYAIVSAYKVELFLDIFAVRQPKIRNGITIPIEVKNVVKATLAEGVKEVKEALNKGVSL